MNASSTPGQPKPVDMASPLSAILVTPPPVTGSAKKRGRPKLSESSEVICWTDEMVEALLNARKANLSSFLDAKDKKAIIRGWSRVALTFNTGAKLYLPIEKIKSKYQNLQKVYRAVSQTEIKSTGNVKLPKKPSYYELLVDHFGGREGMAHQCLNAADDVENQSQGDESSDSTTSDASKPMRRQLLPSSSSRPISQGKTTKSDSIFAVAGDIKTGLVEMSDRLASALLTGQQAPAVNNELQEIKALLKAQAEQNLETNQLLRAFIQSAMQKQ